MVRARQEREPGADKHVGKRRASAPAPGRVAQTAAIRRRSATPRGARATDGARRPASRREPPRADPRGARTSDLDRDFAAALGVDLSGAHIHQDGPAPAATPRQQASTALPGPLHVTWGSHPFRIHFSHRQRGGGSALGAHIAYQGSLPVVGDRVIALEAHTPASATWQPVVHTKAPGPYIELDLLGNGQEIVRIYDEIAPELTEQHCQIHRLAATVNGGLSSSAALWLQYPARKRTDDGGRHAQRQEPGMYALELPIDLDGDSRDELSLRLCTNHSWWRKGEAYKIVHVALTQRSSGARDSSHFELSRDPASTALLLSLVDLATSGRPLTYQLAPGTGNHLRLYPPLGERERQIYPIEGAGQVMYLRLPSDRTARRDATERLQHASETRALAGVSSLDLTLGPHGDSFRITAAASDTGRPGSQRASRARLGIAPLHDGRPVSGMGVEVGVSRAPSLQLASASDDRASAIIDIDGNPEHRIYLASAIAVPARGGPIGRHRDHRLRIWGNTVPDRELLVSIRHGRPRPTHDIGHESHRRARVDAIACSDLGPRIALGTFADQLLAADLAMMPVRARAFRDKLISKPLFEAWSDLSMAMARLRPIARAGQTDAELQARARRAASQLIGHLGQASKSHARASASGTGVSSQSQNPYTGQVTRGIAVENAGGSDLPRALARGSWQRAFTRYHQLVAGLDRWIARQLREREKSHGENGKARQGDGAPHRRRAQLGALERHRPIRIPAIFCPDKRFEGKKGYIDSIPLELYAYKDGETWFLKDLTGTPYHKTVEASSDDPGTVPPARLLAELNDPDRFVVGTICYEIPGAYGGQIRTTDHLTWARFLDYVGLGLAATGLALATFGTGTVAVVGGWALAGSALSTGAASALDLHEHAAQGDLDAATAVLDVAQIIVGLAGAAALAAGQIARAASAAPGSGKWASAWRNAARLADGAYVPLVATAAAAEGAQLAVMTLECARRYDAVDQAPGSEESRRRAKLRVLTQFAVLGGIGVLSIKSQLPALRSRPSLLLHQGPDGIPVVSLQSSAPRGTDPADPIAPLSRQNRGEPYAHPRDNPELPRRHLYRRELEPTRRLELQPTWSEARKALQTRSSVALGKKLKSAEDGHGIIASLARGDASALRQIGIHDYPANLDPSGREWALVQARDGFVIYAGKYGEINLPSQSRALAHNHPGPNPTAPFGTNRAVPTENLPIPPGRNGLTYDEIIGNWRAAETSGITPSHADIHAIIDGTPHVIYTRYVHRGDGKITNPTDGESAARVALHLSDARVVRWNQRTKTFFYEVDVQVKDSAGQRLWTGKMYAQWYAISKQGTVSVQKPVRLKRPAHGDWRSHD